MRLAVVSAFEKAKGSRTMFESKAVPVDVN
jgi:hypothetical protein